MDGEYHGDEYSNSVKLWAKIKANNRLIHARDAAKKDGPFYCPETFEDLIVRKCIDKRDHKTLSNLEGSQYNLARQFATL